MNKSFAKKARYLQLLAELSSQQLEHPPKSIGPGALGLTHEIQYDSKILALCRYENEDEKVVFLFKSNAQQKGKKRLTD